FKRIDYRSGKAILLGRSLLDDMVDVVSGLRICYGMVQFLQSLGWIERCLNGRKEFYNPVRCIENDIRIFPHPFRQLHCDLHPNVSRPRLLLRNSWGRLRRAICLRQTTGIASASRSARPLPPVWITRRYARLVWVVMRAVPQRGLPGSEIEQGELARERSGTHRIAQEAIAVQLRRFVCHQLNSL